MNFVIEYIFLLLYKVFNEITMYINDIHLVKISCKMMLHKTKEYNQFLNLV